MAISDTITSMYTNTSNAYDMLSNGTDLTGINKNLENLSSTIFEAFLEALRNPDTLFTNLPKTSGSGSQITLNGTANAPMRINPNPTAISQTTYTGKNLWGGFNYYQLSSNIGFEYTTDGTMKITGGTVASAGDGYSANGIVVASNDLYVILQAGTYTFSIDNLPTNISWQISSIAEGSTTLNILFSPTGLSRTFTLTEETRINIRFRATKETQVATSTIKIMLAKSETPQTYEPYVGGTSSPNPSYPQDIHTISGDNSIKVEGKNVAYDTIYTSQKNQYYPMVNASYSIVENEYYAISVDTPNTGIYCYINLNTPYGFVRISDNYAEILDGTRKTWIVKAIVTATKTNIGLISRSSGTSDTYSGLLSNFQIEHIANASGTSTTYTPYVSQTAPINLGEYELGTIGNYSNEFVRSGGEQLLNLANGSYTSNGITTTINNGLIVSTGTTTSTWFNLIANASYTLKAGTYTFSIDKSISTNTLTLAFKGTTWHDFTIAKNSTSATLTIEEDINTISITTGGTTSGTSINFSIYAMFNKGTTALPYTPYEKGWYYKQGIGKVVLDGSETIVAYAQDTTRSTFKISNVIPNSPIISASTIPNVKSSHYTPKSYSDSWPIGTLAINGSREIFLVNPKSLIDYDANVFKTWLSSNNVTLYYPLDTPTYTKITGELASQLEQVYKGMLSYDGTTNISQVNNDLAFVINASGILG